MTEQVEHYQQLLADSYAWTYIDAWFTQWLKHSVSLQGLSRDELVAALASAHRLRDITLRTQPIFKVKLEAGPVDG